MYPFACGSYASAFGNHSITGMSPGQQQEHDSRERNQGQNQARSSREQPFNNPAGGYDNEPEDFTKRMERYKTKRDSGMPSRSQPQEIDFTLDGSGSKVQQERMQRQQMEQMERKWRRWNANGRNVTGNAHGYGRYESDGNDG